MPVTMMDVGVMRVRMRHRRVLVEMRVRLAGIHAGWMLVLVVLVVDVSMGVGEPGVVMLVLVPLAQVQPHAGRHQYAGNDQCW